MGTAGLVSATPSLTCAQTQTLKLLEASSTDTMNGQLQAPKYARCAGANHSRDWRNTAIVTVTVQSCMSLYQTTSSQLFLMKASAQHSLRQLSVSDHLARRRTHQPRVRQ